MLNTLQSLVEPISHGIAHCSCEMPHTGTHQQRANQFAGAVCVAIPLSGDALVQMAVGRSMWSGHQEELSDGSSNKQ